MWFRTNRSAFAIKNKRCHNTRQQIFVYLFFLSVYVLGVADADFGVGFRVVSMVLKIFATNGSS